MKPWKKLAIISLVIGLMGIVPQTRYIVFLILPIGNGALDTLATAAFCIFLFITFFSVVMRNILKVLAWIAKKFSDDDVEPNETLDVINKLKEKFN